MRLAGFGVVCLVLALAARDGCAQGRGGAEWSTGGGDAQRSSWLKADPKISTAALEKPGFQLVWKIKFANQPTQLNSLTEAVMLDRYIGYRGFRSLAFLGGSSDNVYAIDMDLGKKEWEVHLSSSAPHVAGSLRCPGGMTANVTRPATIAIAPPTPAGRGAGRTGAAQGAVGNPDEGAVTIAQMAARAGAARGGLNGVPGAPGAGRGLNGASGPAGAIPGGRIGPRPSFVYALSSDGMLHALYVSNGAEPEPPVSFIPANANAHGLTVVDTFAYVSTSNGCGGAPDGVWALDMASKQAVNWKADGELAGSGGPAFGPDGTLYVTTAKGELVALEPKTLTVKATFNAGQPFASSPVIFPYGIAVSSPSAALSPALSPVPGTAPTFAPTPAPLPANILIAAVTRDGVLHLLDTAGFGAGSHPTELDKTPLQTTAGQSSGGALASWQDAAGVRWAAAVTGGAVVAWKVTDRDGKPSLQAGWTSRAIASALPPIVVNGVVFALSSGEFQTADSKITAAARAQRSTPATLYALDSATGKELWNSGNAIASFVHGGALSTGDSQIYLETYDGTIYAFGFPIEH